MRIIQCPECSYLYDVHCNKGCPECEHEVTCEGELEFYAADWEDFYNQCQQLKGRI